MAKKHRRRAKKKIPVFATAGLVASGMSIAQGYKDYGNQGLKWYATGIGEDGNFHLDRAVQTYMPVVVGIAGSALAGKLKVNRYLSSIPIFKL